MSDAIAKVMRLDPEEAQGRVVGQRAARSPQGLSTLPGNLTLMPVKELSLFRD